MTGDAASDGTPAANPATARLNDAFGARRLHLAALDAAVVTHPHRLACGVVRHGQPPPVPRVVEIDRPDRSVAVGTRWIGGRLWLVVEPGGEGVAPVDEVERAPELLAAILVGEGDRCSTTPQV
ncbi:hypothetical protein [Actinomadura sp. SCN-SB]|uniref:hypothetical protein n=1 Tax=Actinomadura sp. SCN-SB TaxID=3373092 RepID=UPI003751C7E2